MEEKQIEISFSEEVAKGHYSNLSMIAHSANEFCVDFISILPNAPKANVVSRIVMTPLNAKRLLGALSDNIRKYEETYGTIGEPQHRIPMIGGDNGLA